MLLLLAILCSTQEVSEAAQESSGQVDNFARFTKPLIIVCDRSFPPYTMLNSEGTPAGMFIDIWRLWSKKTGKPVQFMFVDWADTTLSLESGIADIHSGIFVNEERSASMVFSLPFYQSTASLFFPIKTGKIVSIDQLDGQKVGAVSGGESAHYLEKNYPNVEVVSYSDEKKLISAALEGEIRAAVDETVSFYTTLGYLGRVGEFRSLEKKIYSKKFVAAVLKSRSNLIPLINSGFSAISSEELADIESSWIPISSARFFKFNDKRIVVSERDKVWLKAHPTIRLGIDPFYPPLEFFGLDNTYQGIVSEYVKLLEERLGIQFEVISKRFARHHKSRIDVYSRMARAEPIIGLEFSKSYLQHPIIILTKTQAEYIGSLQDLESQKVVVVRGSASEGYLTKSHPDIQIEAVDTPQKGLEAVSTGKAYAFVGNMSVATYLISKHGFLNLKIAASTQYSEDVSFAVRKDWPVLIDLIDKGLHSITDKEKAEISRKWLTLKFEHEIKTAKLWNLAFKIVGGATTIITLTLLWNFQIRRKEARFRGLTERGMDITLAFKENGLVTYQSPSLASELGYDEQELLGRSVYEIFHKDDMPGWEKVLASVSSDRAVSHFIHRLSKKNGEFRYFESNCISMIDNKALQAIVINARDVTDRLSAEKELAVIHQDLERRVKERSAELTAINQQLTEEILGHKQAKTKIIEYQKSLQALANELSLTEERERRNIAIGLHDQVCQTLALCQLKLATFKKEMAQSLNSELLDEAIKFCQKAITDTRSLIFEISPPALYELGLGAALDELSEVMEEEYRLRTSLEELGDPVEITEELQVTLYRSVREALMNVIKHAKASQVWIRMSTSDGMLLIDVIDNGVGFDTSDLFDRSVKCKSFGLLSIQERLGLLGGKLDVSSLQGKGTTVRLSAPLIEKNSLGVLL